ncbi:Tumor necrosis factor receptor superfamily member 11B [Bienertia sinuspersici]
MMPRTRRGVTHADLVPKPRGLELSSKTGALLTILCILCGLLCFILSLFAEATRSEVTWMQTNNTNNNNNSNENKKGHKGKGEYECVYSGSGKVPLICASVAFVALAIAMLVQHSFMLIAITKTTPPVYVSWDPDSSRPIKSLTWQAAFFFISTWYVTPLLNYD